MRGTLKGQELDYLLMKADHRGVYKRFLVWGWLVPACLLVPCAHLNILLMVYLPPSNCTLPAPPSHLSHEDWRSLATPKTPLGKFDSCALYDFPSIMKAKQENSGAYEKFSTEALPDSTHSNTQHLDTSPEHTDSTTQATSSTPEKTTDIFEDLPGTKSQPSSSQDAKTTQQDTSTFEHIPGYFDNVYTLGKIKKHNTTEHQDTGITQYTTTQRSSIPVYVSSDIEHDTSTIETLTSTPEHIEALDPSTTTPNDTTTSTLEQDNVRKNTSLQKEKVDTQVQHEAISPPKKVSITHDLHNSRVARYFDPFNDLFDPEEVEKNHTQSEDELDSKTEYVNAAMAWQRLYPKESPSRNYTIGCVFGHDFDRTYVQESLAMRFGWVCGESQGVTRILHVSMVGNVIGCFLFGALADKMGRKWMFMILAVKVAAVGSFFVSIKGPMALLILRFFVALGLPAIYQIMIITALEQVRDGERGLVTSISSVCFSLGQCLLGLLAWLTGNWITLGLLTSLPALLALVYIRLLEESPQWLVSRGWETKAALVLHRITLRNNPKNHLRPSLHWLTMRIKEISNSGEAEDSFKAIQKVCRGTCGWLLGVPAFLVTYPYLSFRVVLVTVCWTVNLILYFICTMKYPYVSSNPYLGWFFTSITEVPANLLVPLLLRWVGRRALHSAGLAMCSLAFLCGAGLLAAGYPENFMAVSGLVLTAKFCCCMTYLVVYLQAAELHPTGIRSCVTGLASLVALTTNIFSPSILALSNPIRAYLLLGAMGLVGALSAILLPETAGRSLPQTLQEAENFTWRGTTTATHAEDREEEGREMMEVVRAAASTHPPPPPPPPMVSTFLSTVEVSEM